MVLSDFRIQIWPVGKGTSEMIVLWVSSEKPSQGRSPIQLYNTGATHELL